VLVASLTGSVTHVVGDRGLYAVFVLLLIDALFPAASELVMVYAGALAAGAFAGQHVVAFGTPLHSHWAAFVAVSVAGTLGYLVGAILGWMFGRTAGRTFVERHGRLLHLKPANLARADAWFDRYGNRAVFLGRLTPVVRSFVSIPAGVERLPLTPYAAATLVGSAIWCFGFAAIGWAAGSSYRSVNHAFDYLSIAVVVVLVGGVLALLARRRTARRTHREPGQLPR
jgi:membrane protein DedA with SNARE-associated domain